MTEAEITERLSLYLAAEKKILEGNQEVSMPGAGGAVFRRADLRAIQSEISRLRLDLAAVQQNGAFGSQSVVFGGRR